MAKREKPSKANPKRPFRTSSPQKSPPHILISSNNWQTFYSDLRKNAFRLKEDATVILDQPHRLSEVQPWIESKFDNDKLCHLLRQDPTLLGHPAVWASIWFLIQQMEEEAAFGGMRQEENEWGGLLDIVQAWGEGLFPGYKISIKKPRGRPTLNHQQRHHFRNLLALYNCLLEDIQTFNLCQGKNESRQDWENRLFNKDIPEIWQTFKSQYLINGDPLVKIFDATPSNACLKGWATEIMKRCGEFKARGEKSERSATVRDYLAYCLVGFRYDLSFSEVKYGIESIRKYMKTNTRLSPPSSSKPSP
ncbi:MAG: hypothetical protein KC643_29345 [Nitrospira sp.]|nr:hypothetical protein [Nitrospira sp.]